MAEYAEEEEEEKQDIPDESHKYEYFWRASSPFSQWYPCEFDMDGRTFNCAEQYMIYQKAGMNLGSYSDIGTIETMFIFTFYLKCYIKKHWKILVTCTHNWKDQITYSKMYM